MIVFNRSTSFCFISIRFSCNLHGRSVLKDSISKTRSNCCCSKEFAPLINSFQLQIEKVKAALKSNVSYLAAQSLRRRSQRHAFVEARQKYRRERYANSNQVSLFS